MDQHHARYRNIVCPTEAQRARPRAAIPKRNSRKPGGRGGRSVLREFLKRTGPYRKSGFFQQPPRSGLFRGFHYPLATPAACFEKSLPPSAFISVYPRPINERGIPREARSGSFRVFYERVGNRLAPLALKKPSSHPAYSPTT